MIAFFRGKAATGKSTISKRINNYDVVSKDSIFDELLNSGIDWNTANAITYDKLAEFVQKAHDESQKLIVDIGLAHTPYFTQFLSKMTLDPTRVRYFLFVCSDDVTWEERIYQRVVKPEAPNQFYKSVEEARNHYSKYDIKLIDSERLIDSAETEETMIAMILENLA